MLLGGGEWEDLSLVATGSLPCLTDKKEAGGVACYNTVQNISLL